MPRPTTLDVLEEGLGVVRRAFLPLLGLQCAWMWVPFAGLAWLHWAPDWFASWITWGQARGLGEVTLGFIPIMALALDVLLGTVAGVGIAHAAATARNTTHNTVRNAAHDTSHHTAHNPVHNTVRTTVRGRSAPSTPISLRSLLHATLRSAPRSLLLGLFALLVAAGLWSAPVVAVWLSADLASSGSLGSFESLEFLGLISQSSSSSSAPEVASARVVFALLLGAFVGILSTAMIVVLGLLFVLAVPVLSIEDVGARGALVRSFSMMRRRWGRGLLLGIVLLSLGALLSGVLSFLWPWTIAPTSPLTGAMAESSQDLVRSQAISTVLGQLAYLVTSTLWWASWTVFYEEARAADSSRVAST